MSISDRGISNAVDRVACVARKNVIDIASSGNSYIVVMDNVNMVARVSQAGGGHQNEMHNLTNFIGIQPTGRETQAEFERAKIIPHDLPASLNIEEEGIDRFVVTDMDEDFFIDRKCAYIARIAAPFLEETYRRCQ